MKTNSNLTFQSTLLKWYDANSRDLPWRRTKNPYRIWISEIMLQQTQVETVIPYFEKWIKRFPTVKKLAGAPLSEVLKLWAGLGYYRRAQMLHRAAKLLNKTLNGQLPQDVETLQTIPGIGRYTAGAVASIAFQKSVPVVDGNVIRVLTRFYAIKKDIGSSKTLKHLWNLAEELVPQKRPGDFNQALMELGATVCTPENPECPKCPVISMCKAYNKSSPGSFPVKLRKGKILEKSTAALILRRNNHVYIQKQPPGERWGNLWMFPFWESHSEMIKSGIHPKKIRPFTDVRHGFTKFRILLRVYDAGSSGFGIKEPAQSYGTKKKGKWVLIRDLKKYPFPSPHKKIILKLSSEINNTGTQY